MKSKQTIFNIGLVLSLFIAGCQKNQFDTNRTSIKARTATSYYVSPTGSDNNNGLAKSSPFQTIGKVSPLTLPGDTVFLMAGNFTVNNTITISNSGASGNYITYTALPGTKPKMIVSGAIYNAVVINASYVKFQGIELQGDNANLTLSGAQASYNASIATPSVLDGKYNTNAITVGPTSKTATVFPTHIEVRNCIIHDFPAAGIAAGSADYVTIEGNTVYNNSWYTIYATSGISVITPYDSDNNATTYRNIVRGNTCYNNKTLVNWINIKAPSDGNGIIIDINTTTAGNGPAYTGKTLVENNVSFFNGGSGIHAFSANHVDIINNTAYGNGQVVGYADIYAAYSSDDKVMNNIAYARTGGKTNSVTSNTNVVYDYNIYFNSSSIVGAGAHDIIADPQFINLSSDPAVANFQLKASSPAVNSASSTLFSANDFLGVARPKGSAPDRGAYESF